MWHGFRLFCLILLWLLACVLLALSTVRLHYTLNLPPRDPLNGGKSFYDSVIIGFLVVSGVTILWLPYIIYTVYKRHEGRFRHTLVHSSIGLLLLLGAYIASTAIAAHYWADLSFCWKYWQCRTLTATVGVACSATAVNAVLLCMEVIHGLRHKAWGHPMHAWQDPSKYY